MVTAGELVAMAGPSGSGKTTLLHLMGTLDQPTSGTVRITGLDVARMRDRELSALRASRIGFVFQQFFLAEHQTVLGNVADGLLYAGVRRGTGGAARRGRAGPGRAGPPGRRPARPSCPAGNGSGSPSPGRSRAPAGGAGRRAHRQPRLRHRRGASWPAGGAQRGRDHDHRDHPRPGHRRPDAAPHRDARRAHRRRHQPRPRRGLTRPRTVQEGTS